MNPPNTVPQWEQPDVVPSWNQGWGLFDCGGRWEIQRLDEAGVFESDYHAHAFVREKYLAADPLALRAAAFLKSHCPEEYERVFITELDCARMQEARDIESVSVAAQMWTRPDPIHQDRARLRRQVFILLGVAALCAFAIPIWLIIQVLNGEKLEDPNLLTMSFVICGFSLLFSFLAAWTFRRENRL